MSDLVAILSLDRIEISKSVSPNNPSPKKYQDYLAYCKIEHVLKGEIKTNIIVIPFFQDPSGARGFNGALPAPFTQKKIGIDYLAYLKKSDKGKWLPAAGNHDAALSIKSMRRTLDVRDLELPKKEKKK